MASALQVFYRQFRKRFHDTGAVLPSSRFLARALASGVSSCSGSSGAARNILEVGPGTGAVTDQIAVRLRAGDRLDLVEVNGEFVQFLEAKFREEPRLRTIADQVRIFHQPVETFPARSDYDLIISSLPLNNFTVEHCEQILNRFQLLLKPQGAVAFFEYMAIRRLKSLFCSASQRERLAGIARSIGRFLQRGSAHREAIWLNIPPAWVRRVRFD